MSRGCLKASEIRSRGLSHPKNSCGGESESPRPFDTLEHIPDTDQVQVLATDPGVRTEQLFPSDPPHACHAPLILTT